MSVRPSLSPAESSAPQTHTDAPQAATERRASQTGISTQSTIASAQQPQAAGAPAPAATDPAAAAAKKDEDSTDCCAWIATKFKECFINPIVYAWNTIADFFLNLFGMGYKTLATKYQNDPAKALDEAFANPVETTSREINQFLSNPKKYLDTVLELYKDIEADKKLEADKSKYRAVDADVSNKGKMLRSGILLLSPEALGEFMDDQDGFLPGIIGGLTDASKMTPEQMQVVGAFVQGMGALARAQGPAARPAAIAAFVTQIAALNLAVMVPTVKPMLEKLFVKELHPVIDQLAKAAEDKDKLKEIADAVIAFAADMVKVMNPEAPAQGAATAAPAAPSAAARGATTHAAMPAEISREASAEGARRSRRTDATAHRATERASREAGPVFVSRTVATASATRSTTTAARSERAAGPSATSSRSAPLSAPAATPSAPEEALSPQAQQAQHLAMGMLTDMLRSMNSLADATEGQR